MTVWPHALRVYTSTASATKVGPGAFAKYPVRELLGFTAGDEQMITEQVVNSPGVPHGER